MLEADSLRQVLETKAIAAVTALGFKCQIGDEPFKPPTDGSVYGQFLFTLGKPKQYELGPPTAFECTPGILQFTLYGPEKTGDGPITKLGDALKPYFNRKKWQVPPDGNVTIEVVGVRMIPGVRNGNKIAVVDAGLDFYHRNPTATFD